MRIKFLIFLYLFIGLLAYSFIPAVASAQCSPIYGGGLICTDNSLSIQKQVLNPSTNKFVHNLGKLDSSFKQRDLVTFQITLTNNGNSPLSKIVVKDNFPNILDFSDGPGNFDKNQGVLTFVVDNLIPHHSQLFTITGKVVSKDKFPKENKFCEQNKVSALATSGAVVEDSSQFCLSNQNLSATPATGGESSLIFSLIILIPIGWRLRKMS